MFALKKIEILHKEVSIVKPNFRWLNKGGWVYYCLPKNWHISCLSRRLQAKMDIIAWRD